jgi:LysM repeat protein
MKRRTRLIFIGCAAMSGTFLFTKPAAAHVAEPVHPVAHPASDPPPRVVHAPITRVTIEPGDTLTAIGARTSRTWEQLASYNHLPNPDLIYTDQILTIPPVNFVPVALPAAPAPAPQVVRATSAPAGYTTGGSGVWACIASHESGGNPATNTGNGYYGAFQDTLGSWQAAGGGPGLPSDYSYAQQVAVNQRIQQQQGWGAWPVSSGACGM